MRWLERHLSVEQLVEIEAVHADDAFASAEGDEAVFGEAAVAIVLNYCGASPSVRSIARGRPDVES